MTERTLDSLTHITRVILIGSMLLNGYAIWLPGNAVWPMNLMVIGVNGYMLTQLKWGHDETDTSGD